MYSRDYPGSYTKYYFPFSLKKLCQRKVISIKFKINVNWNKNIFFLSHQLCDVSCQYSFYFFPRVEASCQGSICFITYTFSRAATIYWNCHWDKLELMYFDCCSLPGRWRPSLPPCILLPSYSSPSEITSWSSPHNGRGGRLLMRNYFNEQWDWDLDG